MLSPTVPPNMLLDSCINSTTLPFADQMTWAGCSCPDASNHPFTMASALGRHRDTDTLIQHTVQSPLWNCWSREATFTKVVVPEPTVPFQVLATQPQSRDPDGDSTSETTHTSDGCNFSDFVSISLSLFPSLPPSLSFRVTIYFSKKLNSIFFIL